jgi:hypothetical protein
MVCPASCCRTTVMGRAKSHSYLADHAAMLASSRAPFKAKKSLTESSSPVRLRRAIHWAKRFQCPGGSSERGPSAQYSAVTFWRSLRPALIWTMSFTVSARSREGPGGRNWSAPASANGVTLRQCGVSARCTIDRPLSLG